MLPVAIQHKEEVIERVSKGERLVDIARSLGYAGHAGISNYLADDPEYKLARLNGAEARLETRETELEKAQTMPEISRARELLSHARWRAQTEHPEVWAPKTYVQASIKIEPDAGLIGTANELLDRLTATPHTFNQEQLETLSEVEEIGIQ
jgi:hypothetical protein